MAEGRESNFGAAVAELGLEERFLSDELQELPVSERALVVW